MIDCSLTSLEEIRKKIPHSLTPQYLLDDTFVPIEIEIPFTLKPRDFLKFAQSELIRNDEENLVNCLSNCKRTIECQVDALLFSLGIYEKSKKQGWNFHKKIELLNQLGIVSPKILKKINKNRNLLEHDYIKPDFEKVEDTVDVTILFINYTDKYLKSVIDSLVMFIDNEPVTVNLDYIHGKIIFSTPPIDDDGKIIDEEIITEVIADSKDYVNYLNWYFSLVKYLNRW